MSEIRMELVSHKEMIENYGPYSQATRPRFVRVEPLSEGQEPQFILVLADSRGMGPVRFAVKRDDLLALARAIQRGLAPTPEDQILETLERLADQQES